MRLSDRVRLARVEKVPPGWMTAAQLARREGMGTEAGGFYYVIREAVRQGFLARRVFRVASGFTLRRVAHYRYTKPGKKR